MADLFKGKMFVKNYRCELLNFLKMPLLLSSLIEHARLFSGLMTSHVILCTSLASSVINKMLRNVKKIKTIWVKQHFNQFWKVLTHDHLQFLSL